MSRDNDKRNISLPNLVLGESLCNCFNDIESWLEKGDDVSAKDFLASHNQASVQRESEESVGG